MTAEPTISSDKCYRYILFREVPEAKSDKIVVFIMLNPSTAKAVGTGSKADNDKTIGRCLEFAKDWGYGRLLVVNLFAYRSKSPKDLESVCDPIGPGNDDVIRVAVKMADTVVCAWGNGGARDNRGKEVREMIRGLCEPHVLDLTKPGHPFHPLYVEGNTKPVLWI